MFNFIFLSLVSLKQPKWENDLCNDKNVPELVDIILIHLAKTDLGTTAPLFFERLQELKLCNIIGTFRR